MKITARQIHYLLIFVISILLLGLLHNASYAQNDEGFEDNTVNESQNELENQIIINSGVSSTLNNVYKKKESELKQKPINYNLLIQAINNDYTKISNNYESIQDKSVDINNTNSEEFSAITSLTISRYLFLNKYLFESRIVLEESLELLDKSGFDKERILGQIDRAYEDIISNQSELSAYMYIVENINNNPQNLKDYHNYILKHNSDMDIKYKKAFQEINRIIEVSLF